MVEDFQLDLNKVGKEFPNKEQTEVVKKNIKELQKENLNLKSC